MQSYVQVPLQHPRASALTSNHPKLHLKELFVEKIIAANIVHLAGVRTVSEAGASLHSHPGATKGCETSHGGFRYKLMFPIVYTI